MKKKLIYAVLGNANIAADGKASAIRTSWLHGEVHGYKEFVIEIPDSLLNNPEKYVKGHTVRDFAKNVLCAHNPKIGDFILGKVGLSQWHEENKPYNIWEGRKLEYSPKYKMLRILDSYNNGLFIEL
jgi:hypothetical protein